MTGCVFAKDRPGLEKKLAAREWTQARLRKYGNIVGTSAEVKEQLAEFSEAGLQRIMLQWLDLDDLTGLSELAKVVL